MRKLFVCIALGLTTLTGNAASPLWMRDVQISPDGTEIAFCYKGDIYRYLPEEEQPSSSQHSLRMNVPPFGHPTVNK